MFGSVWLDIRDRAAENGFSGLVTMKANTVEDYPWQQKFS
jgi:hypothetical protein